MDDRMLIVMAVLGLGLASLIVTPVLTWILSRQKEKALEALKIYAEQGRDPPPELLKAIAGDTEWKVAWGLSGMDGGEGGKWTSAIVFGGIALGFGIGAAVKQAPLSDPFWIVTIVCGSLALATFVQALLSRRAK